MSVVVTLLVVVLIAAYAIVTYNQLVSLRKQVIDAWKRVDRQSTGNDVATARQSYTDIARRYNAVIQVFPTNLMAAIAGFKKAEVFEGSKGGSAPDGH